MINSFTIKQVTERDASTGEDGDESSQLYDFALSLFEQCKNAASFSNIDTAIDLFREALDQLSAPHPLRSQSLKDLAGALVTRFYLSRRPEDLDQALPLYIEIERTWNDFFVEAKGQSQLGVGVQSQSNAQTHLYRMITQLSMIEV